MKSKGILAVFSILFLLVSCTSTTKTSTESVVEVNPQVVMKNNFDFTLRFDEAREIIQQHYPTLETDDQVLEFIGEKKIQRKEIDGETFYFSNLEHNLFYRDLDLIESTEDWGQEYKDFINTFFQSYYRSPKDRNKGKSIFSPYFNPKRYLVDYSISVPQEKLPKQGSLKLWLPLPLQTACQEDIEVIDAKPENAVVGYPHTTGDIAYMHYDINLEEIQDLNVSMQYSFKHYQQEFIVNPELVGEYNKDEELYQVYTASSKNIYFNDAMKELAYSIVGEETNPYLMAQQIYYYVVDNTNYSLIAHSHLEAENIPESLAVFERGYGDCGAQSMFFSALCRSVGIPARASGGCQIFFGNLGNHFWAEFYLPNYGWVPVDTSVGQIANYAHWMEPEKQQEFIDFFFGNQDPLRMVIQNDVDIQLDEMPLDEQFLGMVMQLPFVSSEYGNEELQLSLDIILNTETKLKFLK